MPHARPFGRLQTALLALALGFAPPAAVAADYTVKSVERTEMKAVFGKVESRDVVPARARIGGTIVSLDVEEGSTVKAGDVVSTVVDDKLALQLGALDARLKALDAELKNATKELERGKKLLASGVAPKNRVDTLQTQVDVLTNQVVAAQAERSVLVQQGAEGKVIAPSPGRVLTVPVTKGSVVMAGETIARIAGGGYFLRLSLPERHAADIHEGSTVMVGERGIGLDPATTSGDMRKGTLVKVYPEIDGGHVLADVEVDGLGDFFVGERTLVRIPVTKRQAIGVPPAAISSRSGVDYVRVVQGGETIEAAVIVGEAFESESGPLIEILSGLNDGDTVATP